MGFIDDMKNKAKNSLKKIVLPETSDDRIIKAASIIEKNKIAEIILIGKKDEISSRFNDLNLEIGSISIVDPHLSEYTEEFIEYYYEKRQKKGVTKEQSKELMLNDYMFFGAMLVNKGYADGLVGGALNTTAHTLRATIHCVGTKEGAKTISSFFVMISPNQEIGHKGIIFFADCGVIPSPNKEQLADIAEATADNFKIFTGEEPNVAFLSFSTKGSAKTEETEKIVEAFNIFKERRPDISADGELQLDAAIVPSVGNKKAPGSEVAGKANVLIFPDLEAGNIGYKLAQRFGNCEALGPLLQGAKKPVNDLSRGCDVDDIVNVVAITSVQAG